MKKKLPVWLLWPFAVFLLGIWHLLDVRASVTETGHHWLYGWYGGLFFVSMVILVGFGVLIFGKNWGFFDSVSSRCGNALVLKKELVSRKESGSKTECWKLPGLYFGVVMCLGILYMLVLAPLSAPDEVSHYISAYELSNRFLGLPGTDEDGYIYIRAEDDWIEDVNQEFRDWKEKSEQESLNGENGETEAGKPSILGQTLQAETYAAIHDGARSVIRAQNRLWLDPYAAFSALRDRFGTADFRQWGEYARYDEQRLRVFRNENRAAIDFYCFLQYHLHSQLSDASRYARQRGVVLKGDIPIGVSPSSADVWQYPHLFHLDGQAGAPPDAFAATGQNWGFPTYDWEAMARDGYGWWRARLRKMGEYFDIYRIDHILGFFRIWEIPADALHGLLGRFRPALPYTREELAAAGFLLPDARYTRPQVTDNVLRELFGRAAAEVKRRYVADGTLRPEAATQRGVWRLFGDSPDRRQRRIRDGLLRLLDDVLFLEDRERPGHYHPRIAAQATFAYRRLAPAQQRAFDRLYEEFFYRRHDDFWRDEALRKLPALLDATAMLACGEDLGMIPACVPEVMERLGILSLEIERMPKTAGTTFGDPRQYPYLSVGTTSTHDMSPLRSWWCEDTALTQRYFSEVLHRRGKAPAECTPALCRQIVRRTLDGQSMLAVLPLQDWLATDGGLRRDDPDEERINRPDDPNNYWRYRMHLTIEELLASAEFNRSIKRMLRTSDRTDKP